MRKETNNSYNTHTQTKAHFANQTCTRIKFIGYHYFPFTFLLTGQPLQSAIHYTGNAKNIAQSLFQKNFINITITSFINNELNILNIYILNILLYKFQCKNSLTQVSARFHIVPSNQYHELTNRLQNFQTKQQIQNFWQQNISILNLIISIFFQKFNLTINWKITTTH